LCKSSVELREPSVDIHWSCVKLHWRNAELRGSRVELHRRGVELHRHDEKLRGGPVRLREYRVELRGRGVELRESSEGLRISIQKLCASVEELKKSNQALQYYAHARRGDDQRLRCFNYVIPVLAHIRLIQRHGPGSARVPRAALGVSPSAVRRLGRERPSRHAGRVCSPDPFFAGRNGVY